MPLPRFCLKDKRSHETPIYLYYRYHDGRPFKFYFDRTVNPSLWDERMRLFKQKHPHADILNGILKRLQACAVRTVAEYQGRGEIPTHDELRKVLQAEIGQNVSTKSVCEFIRKEIKARSRDRKYKAGSIQIYENCLKHVSAYAPRLAFDDVGLDFLHGFCDYLYRLTTKKMTKFSTNHVQKVVSTLKMFVTEAKEQGLHANTKHLSRKFSVPKKDTTKIYLNEADLMKIWKADMPTIGLERARDTLMICAFTGVRHSDIRKIRRENFFHSDDLRYFSFAMHKGSAPVAIPAHPIVEEILEKYNWKMPAISNQTLNTHLKNVGKFAEINQVTTVITYPGGERHDQVYEKWRLISSHTGRRSLICNVYKSGIPVETIMKISGHKSHASFMRYLRLSHEDHLRVVKPDRFYQAFRLAKVAG